MSTFETELLTLIDQYADAYAAAKNNGNHDLDRSRGKDDADYLYGLIQAKVANNKPPFKRGDRVKNTRYAEAIGRKIRIDRIEEIHTIRRLVYRGGWCLEIERFGTDALFHASDFKK
jgi:hypothetical protein